MYILFGRYLWIFYLVKSDIQIDILFQDLMNKLKPYTVRYRSFENDTLENCFYASDSFEARMLAMEFNKYICDHPNCIDLIRCEE